MHRPMPFFRNSLLISRPSRASSHGFLDQLLGVVELVEEALETDLEGSEEVRQGDPHQGHGEGAANHHQDRWHVDEDDERPPQHDGGRDDTERGQEADETCYIHRWNS